MKNILNFFRKKTPPQKIEQTPDIVQIIYYTSVKTKKTDDNLLLPDYSITDLNHLTKEVLSQTNLQINITKKDLDDYEENLKKILQ